MYYLILKKQLNVTDKNTNSSSQMFASLFSKTNLQKYGCVSPSQVLEFKEKMKLTMISRYGVDNAAKSEEVKEKTRMTNLEKYGVPNTMQSPEVRAKRRYDENILKGINRCY